MKEGSCKICDCGFPHQLETWSQGFVTVNCIPNGQKTHGPHWCVFSGQAVYCEITTYLRDVVVREKRRFLLKCTWAHVWLCACKNIENNNKNNIRTKMCGVSMVKVLDVTFTYLSTYLIPLNRLCQTPRERSTRYFDLSNDIAPRECFGTARKMIYSELSPPNRCTRIWWRCDFYVCVLTCFCFVNKC